ncbi:unnamed protein product, partial [Closterium sp. Yama58-4]
MEDVVLPSIRVMHSGGGAFESLASDPVEKKKLTLGVCVMEKKSRSSPMTAILDRLRMFGEVEVRSGGGETLGGIVLATHLLPFLLQFHVSPTRTFPIAPISIPLSLLSHLTPLPFFPLFPLSHLASPPHTSPARQALFGERVGATVAAARQEEGVCGECECTSSYWVICYQRWLCSQLDLAACPHASPTLPTCPSPPLPTLLINQKLEEHGLMMCTYAIVWTASAAHTPLPPPPLPPLTPPPHLPEAGGARARDADVRHSEPRGGGGRRSGLLSLPHFAPYVPTRPSPLIPLPLYQKLEEHGLMMPTYAIVNREGDGEGAEEEFEEEEDYVVIAGKRINKPFVEKPVDGDDHSVMIYYPSSAGGGMKELFRKVGNRSSEFHPDVRHVRRHGSYIYEEFLPTGALLLPLDSLERWAIALSPVRPSLFSVFSLLPPRLNHSRILCTLPAPPTGRPHWPPPLHGMAWQAKLKSAVQLQDLLDALRALVPHQRDGSDSETEDFENAEKLRHVKAVLEEGGHFSGIYRKAQLKPQKWERVQRRDSSGAEVEVDEPTEALMVLKYSGVLTHAGRAQVGEIFAYACEQGSNGSEVEVNEPAEALMVLKYGGVLTHAGRQQPTLSWAWRSQGGEEPQLRLTPLVTHTADACLFPHLDLSRKATNTPCNLLPHSSSSFPRNPAPSPPFLPGTYQAEHLGRAFREAMYPDEMGSNGTGLLRLHSTYRHDLKIYSSDEGRVQMSAAAFTKGLLDLEGQLTPILVSLVSKDSPMLDGLDSASIEMEHAKRKLGEMMTTNDPPLRIVPVPAQHKAEVGEQQQKGAGEQQGGAQQQGGGKQKAVPYDGTVLGKARFDESRIAAGLPCGTEEFLLIFARWKKLERDIYNPRKERAKYCLQTCSAPPHAPHFYPQPHMPLPTYTSPGYDLVHNRHLGLKGLDELYLLAKEMANGVIPNEYGITPYSKLKIGAKVARRLLGKMLIDLHNTRDEAVAVGQAMQQHRQSLREQRAAAVAAAVFNQEQQRQHRRSSGEAKRRSDGHPEGDNDDSNAQYRLDPKYANVRTPQRHVRTRLYFTSESHLHSVMNVLRFCQLDDSLQGEASLLSPDAMTRLYETRELDYLTHVVLRMYENVEVDLNDLAAAVPSGDHVQPGLGCEPSR